MERGLERLHVTIPEGLESPVWIAEIALHDESDPCGFAEVRQDLTLVDEDGRAAWGVYDYRLVPYSQLVRSVEASALLGDPLRIHLVCVRQRDSFLGNRVWESDKLAALLGCMETDAEHVLGIFG